MEAASSLTTLWWILSIAMIGVGIAGTVLPALPGTALVFAGIVLGAWADGFTRISGWTVGFIGLLAAAAFAVDYLAAILGAKKVGASRLALIGAAIGTVAGVFTGLWGLVFMPLVGAVVGELIAQRRLRQQAAEGARAGDPVVIGPRGEAIVPVAPGAPMPAASATERAARVGLATWVGLLVGTVAKLVLVFLMVGVFAGALLIG